MASLGAKLIRSKLPIGDYALLTDLSTVIDTKQDLQEVYSNIISDHKRFIAEIVKAKDNEIKLIFLVEHGKDINCITDVANWVNPRRPQKGKKPPVPSTQLCKAMETIQERYGCEFLFCSKNDTGKRIIELLGGESLDER